MPAIRALYDIKIYLYFYEGKIFVSNKELNHSANLVITPFVIDHDGDINFEMYDLGNNIVINSFSTTVGSISVNLYTRAQMVENT